MSNSSFSPRYNNNYAMRAVSRIIREKRASHSSSAESPRMEMGNFARPFFRAGAYKMHRERGGWPARRCTSRESIQGNDARGRTGSFQTRRKKAPGARFALHSLAGRKGGGEGRKRLSFEM